jgi:hypothetical protein
VQAPRRPAAVGEGAIVGDGNGSAATGPWLGCDGGNDGVVRRTASMSELERRADLLTQRAARCGVAIEDDLGPNAWWQLSLELDQQAPERSIIRALSTTMEQVVPVD